MFENKVEKQLTRECYYEESEAGRKSVKKLIEEETQQKCDSECRGGTKAKNRRRSCQSEDDSMSDDSEEKFSELIKRLIAQKESEIVSCKKNLVDTFQVLDSKEENIDAPITGDSQRIQEATNSQCTQTIVVLKPEPNSLDVGSSPGLDSTENKAKYGRFGSRFLLSRIRRRLNFGVGKTPCNAQQDSDQDPDTLSSNMNQNCCFGEEIETNPGRRVSDGEILPEIASSSEANKEDTIHGSKDQKKSMCGIYTAAKKHLSEMLAEGDIDVDSPDKEVPRILGKILALPEFSTPESSPRMTLAQEFVGYQITDKPKIQDYSETLGLDSNEETASTSDMPVPIDTEKEEKTVLDSLSEDNFVTHDEVEHKQHLEKSQETFDERHSPCSPPSSSVRMSDCQDNATDVPGKSSPVSVLEPLFTDDELSPNSSKFSSVEMRLQPLCIRFEEPDSPRPVVKTRIDDKEVALAYIQAVVKYSDLNWEEILARSFYSKQILEQALMDDIDFCPTNLCSDKKLLFDCINEVLMEFCGHGPWISFVKPAYRFFSDMENVTQVVQEEVYWHLLPLPSPHTLDQIVQKDLARTRSWMDLRFDIGCIGSEISEIILDELLEEIISNFTELFQVETVNKITIP
ncbi:unnamed protein product [Arabis nemorensis]|uniref:DUF4378 domain-containing protein n=1 Tax=Arabis nemorensis TaxID=586526 RepID=A0A565BA77_9BRAS|nr:unnamed protein product [Arabis nemorensis]